MVHTSPKKVIYAAFVANFFIAVIKFIAAGVTKSSAMLSEAIHSLVDAGNQLILLLGLKRAAKPATDSHPFGHGLQLYFWTFIVAVLIFGLGAGLSIVQGIKRIQSPRPIEHPMVDYFVLMISMVFEGYTWNIARKEFQRVKGNLGWIEAVRCSKESSIFTVLFEDTAALLGLAVALLGIFASHYLNMPILDGFASVIIGLILALTATFLIYELQSLLTGEGVAPTTRASILAIASSEPGVTVPNEVRTMHFGPQDVLVALSLDFADALSSSDVEKAVTNIEKRIKRAHPEVTRVFVEAQSFECHIRQDG